MGKQNSYLQSTLIGPSFMCSDAKCLFFFDPLTFIMAQNDTHTQCDRIFISLLHASTSICRVNDVCICDKRKIEVIWNAGYIISLRGNVYHFKQSYYICLRWRLFRCFFWQLNSQKTRKIHILNMCKMMVFMYVCCIFNVILLEFWYDRKFIDKKDHYIFVIHI